MQAAEQRPFDWRAKLTLGESALNLALLERDPKLADEAIRLHQEVVNIDPAPWWRWEGLAAALITVGQPEEAITALDKSLATLEGTPRAAFSVLLLGMAYSDMGNPIPAIEAFDRAMRLNPGVVLNALNNRGAVYNDIGRYQRAIYDLDEAIKINPLFAMSYNNRGNSYGNLDRMERALIDFDEAIRLDPQLTVAYRNLALAYTYLGKDEEAQMDVLRAMELRLDPAPLREQLEEIKSGR